MKARLVSLLCVTVLVGVLAGCLQVVGVGGNPEGAKGDAGVQKDAAEGLSCKVDKDCPKEKPYCVYVAGCPGQRRCKENGCAALLNKYCGCDGKVFSSTAGCPHTPFGKYPKGDKEVGDSCEP